MPKERDRNWAGYSHQSRRYTSLKKAFEIIGVMESSKEWWTLEELHEIYESRVTRISKRTVRRYLYVFEQLGLVESKKLEIYDSIRKGFRWVSWPPPIY